MKINEDGGVIDWNYIVQLNEENIVIIFNTFNTF